MCFVSRYIPDKHLKNVSLNIQFVLLQIACLLHSHYVFFEVVFCFVDIIILRLKDWLKLEKYVLILYVSFFNICENILKTTVSFVIKIFVDFFSVCFWTFFSFFRFLSFFCQIILFKNTYRKVLIQFPHFFHIISLQLTFIIFC